MKEYRCLITCSHFIQGDVYCGRLIIINLFGEKMETYEMFLNDREGSILMPCENFEEVTR